MLDGMITSGRYKLVSLTVNSIPVEYEQYVTSVVLPLIIKVAPHIVSSSYKLSCISFDRPPIDYSVAMSTALHALIVQGPPCAVYSVRDVLIIEQVEQGTPTQLAQGFEQVIASNPVLPASLVYSTMGDKQVAQHAAIENLDREFPISTSSAMQQVEQVLADLYVFTPISPMHSKGSAELCLQSLVIEHVPISMSYEHAVAEKVLLQTTPDPMWLSTARLHNQCESVLIECQMPSVYQSNASQLSAVEKVLVRRVDRFPRSQTKSAISAELALVGRDEPFARSYTSSYESAELALVENIEPVPFSTSDSAASTSMALVGKDEPPIEQVIGSVESVSSTHLALVESSYPSPTGMKGANANSEAQQIIISNIEPMPSSFAYTLQQGLEWLLASKYQRPEEMLPLEASAFSYVTAHKTVVARQEGNPISTTESRQSSLLTTISDELESPEVMLTSGITAQLVGEQFAITADYPSSHVSQTEIEASLVLQAAATTDSSFPDKGFSASEVQVSQVVESLAKKDSSFASKDLILSSLIVSGAYELVSLNDSSFPSKETAFSYLEVGMVAGVAALNANDYPPKGMVQSDLQATLILEMSAAKTAYPPKNAPTSSLVVDFAGQVIARKDTSMYTMPDIAIKHRPNVSVTLIY